MPSKDQGNIITLCSFLLIKSAFFLITNVSFLLAEEQTLATLDSGKIEVKRANQAEFSPAGYGSKFRYGDTIRTDRDSRASIIFSSGTILRLAPNTVMQFQQQAENTSEQINITEGLAHFFERAPKLLPVIESPSVTTAVRGTEFVISVSNFRTEVYVLNGLVECKNSFGSTMAGTKEKISTESGKAPVKSFIVNPVDAVQWTLNYPSIIDSNSLQNEKSRQTISKVQSLLAAGKVQEAENILNTASQDHNSKANSLIFAQKSIIATVKNDKQNAILLAHKSWEQDSNINSAISLAYAYQAYGKLDLARYWFEQALTLESQNSFVLTRLAELDLGAGKITAAENKITKALEISSNDPYALTTAGFTFLLMNKRSEARKYLVKAIELNNGSGLPHLGYGLLLIQSGELDTGQKQLELAAALEPNVAIYRSYLGKAFFEQKREELAFEEYNSAIDLDSQDPTPYLYRAFSNLSANKSVQALQDIEKSIELNDNRAVYRSSLLLDQDLGVKSAGLAAVFNDLGFSQAARIEAIKSINKNYSNYSAHRLLAGSYNTIFLNDAGLAEDKLSSLLAPLSFNLYSQGSSAGSLNEYNSLFNRDQNQLELNSEYESSDNLFFPKLTASGKTENLGYLLSSDSLYTDENGADNDSHRYRTRLALQYQPDYKELFIIDGTSFYRNASDNRQAPDDIRSEDYNLDLAYRHSFDSDSSLILETSMSNQSSRYISHSAEREISLIQQFQGTIDESLDNLLIDESSREKIKSIRNTAQWIYDSDLFSLVSGTQIYISAPDRTEFSPVLGDEQNVFTNLGYTLESSGYNQLYSNDYYAYSTWHLEPWLDLSAGSSFTQLELEDRELAPFAKETYIKGHLSPKIGMTLYPADDLTIRSAYFETLRKSSLEDQTSIEPTLVGGINQRFTDFSGDLARTYGLGADYKIAAVTYLGIEGLKRHVSSDLRPAVSEVSLDYDTFTATNDVVLLQTGNLHQEQNIIRNYIYQVLSNQLVATINNEWSEFDNTDPEIGQNIKFNKNSLGLKYIDPAGWYGYTEATYRYQKISDSELVENSSQDFILIDLGLGYRLPKQQGALELKIVNLFDQDFEYNQSLGLEELVRDETSVIVAFSMRY